MREGRLPTQLFATIVRQRADTYTLTRYTTDRGPMGQSAENSSTVDVDMWVGPPRDVQSQVTGGERVNGDLMAAALPNQDIEEGDELQYGGVTYSVETVVDSPDRDSGTVTMVSFEYVNAQ